MFKLQANPTFTARVPISVPGAEKAPEITVEFKHFTRVGIKKFWEDAAGKEDADILADIIVGWKGVDQPYSKEALETLLDMFPAANRDLFAAFNTELFESRRKN
jgi:hypothetical protein